jgi:hypothetical protein
MKAAWWFRGTAVVLLLFAAGHSYGFLSFRPASADGLAVWQSMNTVRFAVGNTTRSYAEFYVGFGLFVTAFYVFAAWLSWTLGSMARQMREEAMRLGWAMLVLQCAGLGLALKYFGAGPAVLSAIAAACLGMGIVGLRQETAPKRSG